MNTNRLFRVIGLVLILFAPLGLKAKEKKGEEHELPSEQELLNILGGDHKDVLFQERQELTLSLRRLLGKSSPEQNIFLAFLDQNEFEKALFQWWSAFEKSEFRSSPSGQALYAYLLFRNRLEINGIQSLMSIEHPEKIHPDLVKLWRLLAPAGHPAWDLVQVNWKDAWTHVFDVSTEVQVGRHQIYDLQDRAEIFELLSKTRVGSRERSWLEWQMALSLALADEIPKAAKVLAHLIKEKEQVVSIDLQNLTAGRLLYQQGYLDPAISYYSRIGKGSEYWFVAQEEMAWSYIRKGEPQNVLALTQTLVHRDFVSQVGPETIFLRALAQLKVCDYPGVVKSINEFRNRFRDRASILLTLKERGTSPEMERLLDLLKKGPVSWSNLGAAGSKVPRYASRDQILYEWAQKMKALELEAQIAGELYSRSLTGASDRVGFQARIEELKKSAAEKLQVTKALALARIKNLASEEINEIHRILQKMHIVEAELIQQTDKAEQVVVASSKSLSKKLGTTGSQNSYALRFPFDGETWFDDMANFKVNIKKACQASTRGGKN